MNNIIMAQIKTEEIITKESIDKEIAEKAFVDDNILAILDNIQLILIIGLVCLMIYLTFKQISNYLKKKRKEQEDLLDDQQRNLLRNFKDKVDENE